MTTESVGTLPEPESQSKKHPSLPYFFACIGIIAVIVIQARVNGTTGQWIGHAVTAGVGLVLLAGVILTGTIQSGRIKSLHFRQVYLVHKLVSVGFSGTLIGTFLLGLLVMIVRGLPIITTTHGLIGLTLASLSVVQLVPSLVITKRQPIRSLHTYVGFLIVPLFLFQIWLGLDMSDAFEGGGD